MTSAMVGRIFPYGGDRVNISENLSSITVVPVPPVDTSLVGVSNVCHQAMIGV